MKKLSGLIPDKIKVHLAERKKIINSFMLRSDVGFRLHQIPVYVC